jgi:hypothetical protein
MPPVGFETTTTAGERPQTYAPDCTATGTGTFEDNMCKWCLIKHMRRSGNFLLGRLQLSYALDI